VRLDRLSGKTNLTGASISQRSWTSASNPYKQGRRSNEGPAVSAEIIQQDVDDDVKCGKADNGKGDIDDDTAPRAKVEDQAGCVFHEHDKNPAPVAKGKEHGGDAIGAKARSLMPSSWRYAWVGRLADWWRGL
jgi:hypothetical protein